nr:probably inactive leucine-rich repeat receptor-like protein kinase At5g48380 [Tanacetum cinerariifolium]
MNQRSDRNPQHQAKKMEIHERVCEEKALTFDQGIKAKPRKRSGKDSKEGGNLRERQAAGNINVEGKKMGWTLRFKIAIGIAQGLAWLHHNNVLRVAHLNISSKCILLDEKFEPKISNFGNSGVLMNTSGIPSSVRNFVVPDSSLSPSPYKEDSAKGSNNTTNHDSIITQENLPWMEKRQRTQEKKKDQASRGRTHKQRKRGAKERKIKAAIFIFVAKEHNTCSSEFKKDGDKATRFKGIYLNRRRLPEMGTYQNRRIATKMHKRLTRQDQEQEDWKNTKIN